MRMTIKPAKTHPTTVGTIVSTGSADFSPKAQTSAVKNKIKKSSGFIQVKTKYSTLWLLVFVF